MTFDWLNTEQRGEQREHKSAIHTNYIYICICIYNCWCFKSYDTWTILKQNHIWRMLTNLRNHKLSFHNASEFTAILSFQDLYLDMFQRLIVKILLQGRFDTAFLLWGKALKFHTRNLLSDSVLLHFSICFLLYERNNLSAHDKRLHYLLILHTTQLVYIQSYLYSVR